MKPEATRLAILFVFLALAAGVVLWWRERKPAAQSLRAAKLVPSASDPAAGAAPSSSASDTARLAVHESAILSAGHANVPKAILQRIAALKVSAREPLSARQLLIELERLRELGASALPSIHAYLASGQDADYESVFGRGFRDGHLPTDFTIPPSLRLGLFEVVKNIGGAEAEALLVRELKTSGRGVEIAYLAGVLQQLAPDTYREATLAAARDLLAMPLTIRASNPIDRSDREYLYGVLVAANDRAYVAETQQQLLLPDGRVDRGALGYLQQILREQAVAVAAQAWQDSRIAPDEKEPLARLALAFVGASADDDRLYQLALAEPALTSSQRQNLIEDLNEAGFSNPRQPAPADLPLIQKRLALIEQLAPHFPDRTAAAAFVEVRKDLLNMRDSILNPPPKKKG